MLFISFGSPGTDNQIDIFDQIMVVNVSKTWIVVNVALAVKQDMSTQSLSSHCPTT